MFKNIKGSIPLWLGITAFLCYGDMFFEMENLIWFTSQFLVVSIAGSLIILAHEYLVGWIYEARPKWFKTAIARVSLYCMINLTAVYLVILGVLLLDSSNTFSDYRSSFINSGMIVIVITVIVYMYNQYRYRVVLAKKQKNTL